MEELNRLSEKRHGLNRLKYSYIRLREAKGKYPKKVSVSHTSSEVLNNPDRVRAVRYRFSFISNTRLIRVYGNIYQQKNRLLGLKTDREGFRFYQLISLPLKKKYLKEFFELGMTRVPLDYIYDPIAETFMNQEKFGASISYGLMEIEKQIYNINYL